MGAGSWISLAHSPMDWHIRSEQQSAGAKLRISERRQREACSMHFRSSVLRSFSYSVKEKWPVRWTAAHVPYPPGMEAWRCSPDSGNPACTDSCINTSTCHIPVTGAVLRSTFSPIKSHPFLTPRKHSRAQKPGQWSQGWMTLLWLTDLSVAKGV